LRIASQSLSLADAIIEYAAKEDK
jgi:hypothetical protein